jgi:hypothetical protein
VSKAEQIRSFILELPADSRLSLMRALDRARLKGERDPVKDLLMDAMRDVVRQSAEEVPRVYTASRLFFEPLEDFLINEELPTKLRGRISRKNLGRIWTWIERDVAPNDAAAISVELPQGSIQSGTDAVARDFGEHFRDRILSRLQTTLGTMNATPEGRRRLAGLVGGDRALEDLEDTVAILEHDASLQAVQKAIPTTIEPNEPDDVATCASVLARSRAVDSRLCAYAAMLIAKRVDGSARLPRLAIATAGSTMFQIVLASPGGTLIDIALSDLEALVVRFEASLTGGHQFDKTNPASIVREYNLLSRNLRAALDFDNERSQASSRILDLRGQISKRVTQEIGELQPLLRRCAKPMRGFGTKTPTKPDAIDVERAYMLLELFDACRLAVSELAINELIQRMRSDIEGYLDNTCDSLTQELRTLTGQKQTIALEHARSAAKLIEALHGKARAGVVRKSFEVASGGSFTKAQSF